jgi:ADP-ribose pyrophosphatase YjhB (NUDIX family)
MVSLLVIVKNNHFLLFKRDMSGGNPGMYGFVGGTAEKNETPTETLIREVREEIGMEIYNVQFLKRYNNRGNIMNLFYVVNDEFNEQDIRLSDEHTGWKYFSYYELLNSKEVIPNTVSIINDFLRTQ